MALFLALAAEALSKPPGKPSKGPGASRRPKWHVYTRGTVLDGPFPGPGRGGPFQASGGTLQGPRGHPEAQMARLPKGDCLGWPFSDPGRGGPSQASGEPSKGPGASRRPKWHIYTRRTVLDCLFPALAVTALSKPPGEPFHRSTAMLLRFFV